jgi:hypothetical protein
LPFNAFTSSAPNPYPPNGGKEEGSKRDKTACLVRALLLKNFCVLRAFPALGGICPYDLMAFNKKTGNGSYAYCFPVQDFPQKNGA